MIPHWRRTYYYKSSVDTERRAFNLGVTVDLLSKTSSSVAELCVHLLGSQQEKDDDLKVFMIHDFIEYASQDKLRLQLGTRGEEFIKT